MQGLTSPPPTAITLAAWYSIIPTPSAPFAFNDNSLVVPDGYVAKTWFFDAMSAGGNDPSKNPTTLRVAVGGYGYNTTLTNDDNYHFFAVNQNGAKVQEGNPLVRPAGTSGPSPGDAPNEHFARRRYQYRSDSNIGQRLL